MKESAIALLRLIPIPITKIPSTNPNHERREYVRINPGKVMRMPVSVFFAREF